MHIAGIAGSAGRFAGVTARLDRQAYHRSLDALTGQPSIKLETMIPGAPLERVETGVRPSGEGWFVVNAREVPWFETDGCGFYAVFEPENARFDQVGFGLGILRPVEPSALYHGEDAQEDFLVLSGECLLLIEGEE